MQAWISLPVVVDWGDGTNQIGTAELDVTKGMGDWTAAAINVTVKYVPDYVVGALCQSVAAKQAVLDALNSYNPHFEESGCQVWPLGLSAEGGMLHASGAARINHHCRSCG